MPIVGIAVDAEDQAIRHIFLNYPAEYEKKLRLLLAYVDSHLPNLATAAGCAVPGQRPGRWFHLVASTDSTVTTKRSLAAEVVAYCCANLHCRVSPHIAYVLWGSTRKPRGRVDEVALLIAIPITSRSWSA